MANRIVHFEIHAEDPERAIRFYQEVFGWEFPVWMEEPVKYWGVMTAEKDSKELGINGGLLLRKGTTPAEGQPVNAYVCTVQVDDIDATIGKIEGAGGTLALAKHAIMGMAWQAYYKDTEGNIFGIHQPDENAK
ncbi:VOC family protein [Candidatus Kaiserbacteria bacterium]|nr:VOC family protein [Candidatus Kaiserbacteria bacterium]